MGLIWGSLPSDCRVSGLSSGEAVLVVMSEITELTVSLEALFWNSQVKREGKLKTNGNLPSSVLMAASDSTRSFLSADRWLDTRSPALLSKNRRDSGEASVSGK